VHFIDYFTQHASRAACGYVVEQAITVIVLLTVVDADRVVVDQEIKEFVSLLAAGDIRHRLSPLVACIQVSTVFEKKLSYLNAVVFKIAQTRYHEGRTAVFVF